MNTRSSVVTVITLSAVVGLGAQKTTQIHPGRGGSPHVRSEWTIDGAHISITYGRPYLKGRVVGKDLAQFGYVWRAGADESTTLTSDRTLVLGGLTVPAGSHTLWVLPAADKWHLIVNKATGQWGTDYDEHQDLGRAAMTVEKLARPTEQHTIAIDPRTGGGTLRIEFGAVRATVPLVVRP